MQTKITYHTSKEDNVNYCIQFFVLIILLFYMFNNIFEFFEKIYCFIVISVNSSLCIYYKLKSCDKFNG